jgi:hypothetical protein
MAHCAYLFYLVALQEEALQQLQRTVPGYLSGLYIRLVIRLHILVETPERHGVAI